MNKKGYIFILIFTILEQSIFSLLCLASDLEKQLSDNDSTTAGPADQSNKINTTNTSQTSAPTKKYTTLTPVQSTNSLSNTKIPADSNKTNSASPSLSTPNSSTNAQNSHLSNQSTQKKIILHGRIEELSSESKATLPLKLQSVPSLGNSSVDINQARIQQSFSGQITKSFPVDYRGTWSGTLRVHYANFDRASWEFDSEEANKESQLMKPGTQGQVTVTFYQGNDNRIHIEPCEVVFTTTVSASQYGDILRRQMPDLQLGQLLNDQTFGSMQMPYMYALHLGDLTTAMGVTGNQLHSQLMKNELRQLAPNILEQVVVTHDYDRNPKSGKERVGYSESVLRFTRTSGSQLYLQAASVSYGNDGKFLNKSILYGTLNKTANTHPTNPYTSMFDQLNNGPNRNSDMSSLQQLQQLLQNQNSANTNSNTFNRSNNNGSNLNNYTNSLQQLQQLLQDMNNSNH